MCLWCKHFGDHRTAEGFLEISCAAFPTEIPDEIFEGDFDHREPYPGDNGIRFERAFSEVLKERTSFKNAHDLQELVDLIDVMFQQFDMRRAQGTMQPPLQPDTSAGNS
jgi:hypothetical protein